MCYGSRAQASSSLQQQKFFSLISQLTEEAVLHSKDVPGLEDGERRVVFEGRGAHRDVYRVGSSMVLKLIRPETEEREHSHENEAIALRATASPADANFVPSGPCLS